MRALDTTEDAEAAQVAAWRRFGPEGRVRLAARMSVSARHVSMAGIRSRHPDYTEDDARWALLRALHGDETFRRAWPGAPLLAP